MKKITLFMLIVFTSITLQGQNKLLSIINESYDGASWQKYAGTNYDYDSNDNLIAESYYNYDLGTSAWKISYKTIYTYNVSNKVSVSIDQDWNATTNMLENSYKSSYSYSSGNLIGEIDQKWVGSVWVNEYKTDITYGGNGLLESALFYNWDGSQWVLDTRDTLTYGSNNKISSDLNEKWNGLQWVNSSKTNLTYNANDKIVTYSYTEWDVINGIFIERNSTDYILDANGNRASETYTSTGYKSKQEYIYDTSSLMSSFANPFKDKTGVGFLFEDFPYVNKSLGYNFFTYDTATSSYIISGRTIYDYNNSIVLATEKFITANAIIKVYPNPTQDFLSIQTSLNNEIDKVIVTDLSGKIVLKQYQNSNQVNVQNLAKGMYLLQIFSGDNKWNSKFLKE